MSFAILEIVQHLEEHQSEWSNHQTWQDQIEDASVLVRQANAVADDAPLHAVRAKLIEASARLIDAAQELGHCIEMGEV
ncbi:hypothetical protein GCM10007973_18080 [Polymorphobacter multimanifer]|uniref:Uncharacterized protein n=1 Tax=Polymorphobacter multimanifer TaxID=1070431 RepID=A0A841LGK3_9SPHN|nr:hypothetical protein [Polymorphobacter multimanifer]MBB6228322.1 hypothetical protein [Polymorphobacter multimanifer]GGI82028.1 hypothetical protein GCM10007973_18080 [Polymorphobacter multimanifer]